MHSLNGRGLLCFRLWHSGEDFSVTVCDHLIVLWHMRVQAFAAVLYAVLRVDEVAAAAVTQHIQRAIAEQAVEIVGVGLRMAGEIFAFSIAEEGIVGAFVFHIASLAKTKCGGRPSQHRSVKKVLRRPARGYVYSLSKAVHIKSGKEKSPAPRAELRLTYGRTQTGVCSPPHSLRKSAEREAPNRQVFWLCFIVRLPSQPKRSVVLQADSTSQRRHRTGFTPVSLFSHNSV